jgi:hypothetical protein
MFYDTKSSSSREIQVVVQLTAGEAEYKARNGAAIFRLNLLYPYTQFLNSAQSCTKLPLVMLCSGLSIIKIPGA